MGTAILIGTITGCFLAFMLREGFLPRRLAVAVLVAEPLAGFLKRAIFFLGPQSRGTYYAVQALPVGCIVLGAALAIILFPRQLKSGRWLSLFFCIGLVTTALGSESWAAKALRKRRRLPCFPLLAFMIAVRLTVADLGGLAKCYVGLLVLSVPFALAQLVGGPSALDRVWALGAGEVIDSE